MGSAPAEMHGRGYLHSFEARIPLSYCSSGSTSLSCSWGKSLGIGTSISLKIPLYPFHDFSLMHLCLSFLAASTVSVG